MSYKVIKRGTYRRCQSIAASKFLERSDVASYLQFIDRAQQCIDFIASNPYACPVHTTIRGMEFHRWYLRDFSALVFYTIREPRTVLLEALYAPWMDIARLDDDP